jgi:glucose/arabinose dehydrogenase
MRAVPLTCLLLLVAGCGDQATLSVAEGSGPKPNLPPPRESLIPTVNIAPAVGWPAGATPVAAAGLRVGAFATGLDHPRWVLVLPNGDVLVAESNSPPKPDDSPGLRGWVMGLVMGRAGAGVPSADRITLLRDTDGDGVADQRSVFLEGLHSPFGMALVGRDFYVANTDGVMRYDYEPGETRIAGAGTLLAALPAGTINHHWTKNIIASPDGSRIYATVGSNSNVAENGIPAEEGRAAIWEIDRASGAKRAFATGLRNPNGMMWVPESGALWTAVNERDELGSDLVPDYMTSVRDGGFYGWPYSYYGQHVDTRVSPPQPELMARALVPDYALGPHTASLGLAWGGTDGLPAPYANGAFIGQHGSWNRKPASGYKVVFVPFTAGQPSGAPSDMLTGFLDTEGRAMGRPVGVAPDGKRGLLVADDVGNVIWRVTAAAQ